MAESGGGPLGVEDVKEVIVGVSDLEAARSLWQRLLDPAPISGSSSWQVGDGPAIRLVQAKDNTAQGLVIRFTSLQRAKAFLQETVYSELIPKKTQPLIRPRFMASTSESWARRNDDVHPTDSRVTPWMT